MLAMVRQKEKQQQRLKELKNKRQKEEGRRRAEIERLKAEKKEKLVAALEEDIRKYQEIVSSPFGKEMKEAAWKTLVAKYPEAADDLETGDTEGLMGTVRAIAEAPVLTDRRWIGHWERTGQYAVCLDILEKSGKVFLKTYNESEPENPFEITDISVDGLVLKYNKRANNRYPWVSVTLNLKDTNTINGTTMSPYGTKHIGFKKITR